MMNNYDGGESLIVSDNPLATLINSGGYYACPRDEGGIFQGDLVAYAGTYDAGDGTEERFVGTKYFNFAKAEIHPQVLRYFARHIRGLVQLKTGMSRPDVVLSTPLAGLALGVVLSQLFNCPYIFAEKKGSRGAQELVMSRHDIPPGAKVLVCEELVNNITSATKVVQLIEEAGAEFLAVAGAINRNEQGIQELLDKPIIMAIDIPTPQYRRDHPLVRDILDRGFTIIEEAKPNWTKLEASMKAAADIAGLSLLDWIAQNDHPSSA